MNNQHEIQLSARRPAVPASEDAILSAALCYQAQLFFQEETLILPQGYKLQYTIHAAAGIDEPVKEIFGFIAESDDTIIITFRGAASLPDMKSALDIFQVPYPFVKDAGKTHRGSTYIYQSTRHSLMSELTKFSYQKKLLITGHSLGGGLATLFAFDTAVNTRFRNPSLYTIASLRIGDPIFAARFNEVVKTSIRIYNVHDLVPAYPNSVYPPPFTKDGLAYEHTHQEFPLDFQLNNMGQNHMIFYYFKALSEKNPLFAESLCKSNPGFCPVAPSGSPVPRIYSPF